MLFCIYLFQAVCSSTTGGNDCLSLPLACPLFLPPRPPQPLTHLQPQSHRSPWALPLQASGPHSGLLVWHAEPVLSRPSRGCARWRCSHGVHGARSRLDHTRPTPVHLQTSMLVSTLCIAGFLGPKCLGIGNQQENPGRTIDCYLIVRKGDQGV